MNRKNYLKLLILTLIISTVVAIGMALGVSNYIVNNIEWEINPESIKSNQQEVIQ